MPALFMMQAQEIAMDRKEAMPCADNLPKHISELSDKDLVLMVTLDREEYREDVLGMADSELKRRNIAKATIDRFLQSLDLRGREAEKKGKSYMAMGEPGSDEEEELWEEANLPNPPPRDFDCYIFPLTNRMPEPFFTEEAENRLREKRCVLCAGILHEDPHYCLVGRHRKKRAEGVVKKIRYRYQACYAPICSSCYSKYNRALISLAILLWLGVVFVISAYLQWKVKKEISLFIALAAVLGVIMRFLGQQFVRGWLLNRKVIVGTPLYPHLGIPRKRKELLKTARSELKPLPPSVDRFF